MANNDIYELELFEEITIGRDSYIMRVPGGWVYTNTVQDHCLFIPFNNEFQKIKEKV